MANEQNSVEKRNRISNTMLVFMVLIALIFDLISLIPVVNTLTLAIAGVLFTLWWWKLGLGLIDLKKVINYGMAIVIEVIPFLSMLPGITVAVLVMFAFSRFEDKSGMQLTGNFSRKKKGISEKTGRTQARKNVSNTRRQGGDRSVARSKGAPQARSKDFVKLPNTLNT